MNDKQDLPSSAVDPLDGFTPTSLTAAQWRLARPGVLAAVRSIPGLPLKQHKPYASRLCRFLAVSAWDRTSAPDFGALLTDKAVGSLVSAAGMPDLNPSARGTYRKVLRRIGRTSGSIPVRSPSTPGRPSPARRSFWLGVAGLSTTFPVITAVYENTGRCCHPGMWTGFGEDLNADLDLLAGLRAESAASVPVSETVVGLPGTVIDVRRAARDLWSAINIDLSVVSPIATSPSADSSTIRAEGPCKPASRRARVRQARAALQRAEAAAAAPTAVPEADLPTVDPDVQTAINAYKPTLLDDTTWVELGGVIHHALRAYRPSSTRWVHDQAGHVTSFVNWAARTNRATGSSGPLTADLLVVPGLVERYLDEELAVRPDSSRATVRSVLRRVVRNLSGAAPERIKYVPIQAPYSEAECAVFVRLARNQPTTDQRRALSTFVALGLGAGLDGGDQREVTPADITDVDLGDGVTGLLVNVRGQRPRTVVVRAAYEPLLREAVALHNKAQRGRNTPLYGLSASRRNVTSTVTSRAVTATGKGVDINAARLRATWLLACMNSPVPLAVLLSAAGLKTARTFTDLLAYCPPADDTHVAAVLRAIEGPAGGESR